MFVIIHHCSMPFLIVLGSEWVLDLYCIIMPFTMAAFTMISGFFFKEKPIKERINTYLVPLIIFSIVNLVLQHLSLVPYIRDRSSSQLGYAMWYLYVLFIYTILTQILVKKVSVKAILATTVVITLLICNLKIFSVNNVQFSRLVSHYPFFLMGILMREHNWLSLRKYSITKYVSFFIFVSVLLLNLYLCKLIGTGHFLPAFTTPVPYYVELYGLIICSLTGFCVLLFAPNTDCFITKLGRRTMTPYVLHMCLVFPICWNIGLPALWTKFGIVLYMMIVPSLCLFLYSEFATKKLNQFLDLFRIKSKI